MGASESIKAAQVIDENDEYRNAVLTNFHHYSPSSSGSSSSKRRSVDRSGLQELEDVTSSGENVFSLIADILETYGENTNKALMKLFLMLKGAKYFCEGAGIVLNLLVDEKVVAHLNKICEEIREVRSYIKELERNMKWETTRIQYADICTMIVVGMEFCNQIQSNAGNDSLKHDYEERLKELCSNQKFSLAIITLLDGITGKGDFRIDILQLIYEQTNGVRPDIIRMAGRLLQLLSGGMITLLTYETLMRGRQSAEQLEVAMFADRMKEAEQCYINVIQRCVEESKEKMARDIDRICEGEQNLKDLPKQICDELARKYDWLQFQCMAYRNAVVRCHGSRIEKCISGRPGGNIICFCTSKGASLKKFSSSEKSQMDDIISNRHRSMLRAIIRPFRQTPDTLPDGYDPVIEYLTQTGDQRQCWVVGSTMGGDMDGGTPVLKVFHEVSIGSYEHLIRYCRISCKDCFVSMFFQD